MLDHFLLIHPTTIKPTTVQFRAYRVQGIWKPFHDFYYYLITIYYYLVMLLLLTMMMIIIGQLDWSTTVKLKEKLIRKRGRRRSMPV